MIAQEKIEKAAEESHKFIKDESDKFFMKDSFKLGVLFAETELQNIAIELLHYYRHAAFEKTCGKSDMEIFTQFMSKP